MNFVSSDKKFRKILFILTAISFLWIGTFGLLSMGQMKTNGTISGCLFSSGQMELCSMSFSDHITLWQSLFTGVPKNTGLLFILTLVIVLLFSVVILWQNPFFEFSKRITFRFRIYIKQHYRTRFNFLKEVFSQGILNSKIYSSVTL